MYRYVINVSVPKTWHIKDSMNHLYNSFIESNGYPPVLVLMHPEVHNEVTHWKADRYATTFDYNQFYYRFDGMKMLPDHSMTERQIELY